MIAADLVAVLEEELCEGCGEDLEPGDRAVRVTRPDLERLGAPERSVMFLCLECGLEISCALPVEMGGQVHGVDGPRKSGGR